MRHLIISIEIDIVNGMRREGGPFSTWEQFDFLSVY